MKLGPIKQFSFTPQPTTVQTKQTSPQVEDNALPQEQVSVGQSEPVSYSHLKHLTMGFGLGAGSIAGVTLSAVALSSARAAMGLTGHAGVGLALATVATGALLGSIGGTVLAPKVSEKLGEWGSKLASKLGYSSKGGEAAGQVSLLVGLGAAIVLAGPTALLLMRVA